MRSSFVGAAITALVLTMTVAGARAQNSGAAEVLFDKAMALKKQGKLAEACEQFFASQKLDPSPSTLMNVADCREKNGQLASAWEAYVAVERQVRGDGKYGKMADLAQTRAAALEGRLSTLTVNVADGVRVEGLIVLRDGTPLEPGAWNTALPIDGGAHTISGRAPGHETWSTTITVAAEGDKQQVEMPRFKALRDPTGKTIVINRTEPSRFTPRRKVAIGVAGAGVAVMIAGAYFGLHAQSLQDGADNTCPQDGSMCTAEQAALATQRSAEAADNALYANVAFGVGAAAIAGGAILWLTGAPQAPEQAGRVSFTPRVSPSYVGARAEVRF